MISLFSTRSGLWLLSVFAACFSLGFRGAIAQVPFGGFGASNSPIKVSAVIDRPEGLGNAVLVVTAEVQRGYKTYSITQPPGGPIQTEIRVKSTSQYSVGNFRPVQEPMIRPEPIFQNLLVEEHHGKVTWIAPLRTSDGVNLDSIEITGSVYAQACNKNGCLPPKDHPFVAKLGKSPMAIPRKSLEGLDASFSGLDAVPSSQPVANNVENSQPPAKLNDPKQAAPQDAQSDRTDYDLEKLETKTSLASSSLPWMLLAALLAGFFLNFMPCVLPVIGLKILSFLEQDGRNPGRALLLNAWYSVGILSVFWVLAAIAVILRVGFGQQFGWGQQFSYDGFNIAMVSIVFVMALSFLGVWEIPIPGFVGGKNSQKISMQEGAIGAFAKGVVATLLATPCSGPFLGTAVAFALGSSPLITMAVFTCMGLGMAAPYLIVGFRPSLIRLLPKPGAWMDTFKQLMGFVLIGTVLWLMVPIDAHLLMPTLVLLAGLSASCWWIGRIPGYAENGERVKGWLLAISFAGFVGWVAFAMPQVNDPLPWRPFTMAEFVTDVNSGNTVLLEFTADWCATCKALKAANLDRSKTKAVVVKNKVTTYEVNIDRISTFEREFFTRMQASQGVPLIAIFPSGKKYAPITFGNGYTQAQILGALAEAGPSQTAKPSGNEELTRSSATSAQ
ncbi:MAG: cytochrome c biogenesis protein CcdA [Pirellula sp.]